MANAQKDANYVPSLIGVSSVDQTTPTLLEVDPATGRLLVTASITGGGAGGTASQDDSAFTAATGNGTPAMGFVTSDSVDSGDVGVLGMLANRQLKVTLFDSSGVELAVGGGTQYTEDAAAAANPVGNVLNLVRNDARSGALTTTDGDNVAARGTNSGELYVKHVDAIPVTDNSGSLTVDNGGTFAVQATAVGTIADDATTPGAPVMVGGFAISPDGTDPGSVSTEADVARFRTDLNRRLLVSNTHPRSLHTHLDGSSAYTDQSIAADPGDGFQIVITSIIASTGAATALNFFLEEGSTKIFGPIYLEAVAGRGFASGPIYLPITASTAVTLTSSASIAQSFDIDYFIQAV